jgi:hypothetical protein
MDALDNPGAGGSMPLFAVTRRMGEQLWALFDNADSVVATIERYAQGWPAFEDIASFSSFGPTADGRIKPDIVGPGEMVSAASGDMDASLAGAAPGSVCLTGRKSGTSMATPLVAAYSAIVRQYFMDGFYPSGGPSNAPHTPSGPLIKGVLMGGACDMQVRAFVGRGAAWWPRSVARTCRVLLLRWCAAPSHTHMLAPLVCIHPCLTRCRATRSSTCR